jgi:integrase
MNEIQISLSPQSEAIDVLIRQATTYYAHGKSASTRASYASDQKIWEAFCTRHALPALPSSPEVVSLFIADCAGRAGDAVSTIKRRVAALCYMHRQAGYSDWPTMLRKSHVFREVLAGIMRTHSAAQVGAEPFTIDQIRAILSACPQNFLGLRDRSLILLGFSLGSRRSELASVIEVSDLTFTPEGVTVRLSRGKADPFGLKARVVAIPLGEHEETCAVLALRAWLSGAKLSSGPLYRAVDRWGHVSPTALNPRSVAKILAAAMKRAGMDKDGRSPHSLRVGFCTTASSHGHCTERAIAKVTGHRSNVLRRYIREVDPFGDSASGRLGL